ncbi:DUF4132 domain-containing protein [Microtetraspora sp. NBRC 16547]|uniref:DUF4132 domain-containing protein n=1 Tax=Microtetraspora sp. NBRC 16547 TaxID=3030993 RepID=UPI0024A47B83|nr:DUF4132 domain-containing protein [Microtetraspora sp. NBRC 16547]GLW97889.1 hypothetical protein Misp02_19760 [Microtetraspora sp. NBRC 16547]
MRLSPTALQLHTLLTDPAADDPYPRPDPSQLTAFDLGTLLPFAYRAPVDRHTAISMRFVVEDAARERQPSFTPEACADLFLALVDGLKTREWSDLPLAAAALARCPGGPPLADLVEPARTLVRFHLHSGRTEHPYALLAVAGIAGLDDEAAAVLTDGMGPIAAGEIGLLLGWETERRALLADVLQEERSYNCPPPLPDAWERLAAIPEYTAFARTSLEAAEARVAAIHAGEIPYRADRAFDNAEKAALGRAARLALWRDEPWLPGLLDRLLRGVAVAPTAAKTLPSQGLLYEIARAAEEFPTPEAVTALRAAREATRHAGVLKQLDRMLKRIERALADRVEVAFRMPDLGFEPGGRIRVPVGEHTAVISIGDDVELTWWQGEKRLKGAPAAVRRDHPDEVKRLRELAAQVRRQLTTLVRALEAGYPGEAVHPYATWRERLAEHPIAGTVARRLIWEIELSPGRRQSMLGDTGIGGIEGIAGTEPPPDAPVRLWHPAHASLDDVRAWRERITEERIRQPFKQAFREVYLLTPAEERAGVYSNRFAAHVVDYRKLYAQFKQRGWAADMLGPWDGGDNGEARRVLTGGRWRASFFHDNTDGSGEHATTDQVRFHRNADGEWRQAALAEVPRLVFSEAMRDVDLFVAVTSIAADPGWADRGADRHHEYWRSAAFGPLPPSAEVRRDALARLLPRTAIADRCTLTDRYLVVRGDLRAYKIHLGSANILMDPGDVYLCVVSAPGQAADRVFLPFEEDGRLALILSKAFLLARDGEIDDETILRQIKGSTAGRAIE